MTQFRDLLFLQIEFVHEILSNRWNDDCHDANKLKVLEHEAVVDNGCTYDTLMDLINGIINNIYQLSTTILFISTRIFYYCSCISVYNKYIENINYNHSTDDTQIEFILREPSSIGGSLSNISYKSIITATTNK